jgi:hypothetical protein
MTLPVSDASQEDDRLQKTEVRIGAMPRRQKPAVFFAKNEGVRIR